MNELSGTLLALEQEHGVLLADVAVGSRTFTALLLHAGPVPQWPLGSPVSLGFKETEIALAKNLSGDISFRNRHPAVITGLTEGKLLTAVQLLFDDHTLTSVITSGSARRLQLRVNDPVEWLVKSNEMQLCLLNPAGSS